MTECSTTTLTSSSDSRKKKSTSQNPLSSSLQEFLKKIFKYLSRQFPKITPKIFLKFPSLRIMPLSVYGMSYWQANSEALETICQEFRRSNKMHYGYRRTAA